MTPDRWEKISEIFSSAAELPEGQRAAFLKIACGDDHSLRLEVESLLQAENDAGKFISEPIVGRIDPKIAAKFKPISNGTILGHYRIERAIGSGGMGEVYLATDTKLNRPVALKTLPPIYVTDPGFLKRFRNEAQAAATLNHPNAATIFSVEDNESQPFITMEYVDGQTLDHLTPESGLLIETFLAWFEPIADALAHAHEKGIIHRDIKPGNIMISSTGLPKILDFGLAQFDPNVVCDGPTKTDITAPGQIIGTPSYMSPEQAEGHLVDLRSDIFSLGTVMYEALAGTRPFKGKSYNEIVRHVVTKDPEPIAKLRPETPAVIAKMIGKCLEKLPADRFESMRDVRSILKEARTAIDAGVSMDSFARSFYRETSSSSKLWWAASALLVLILSLSAWYFFSRDTNLPTDFANMTFRKLSQSNNVVFAQITPDGKSIVYNTIEENERRSMWIRRVADRNALRLLPPEPVQFWGGLTISADGSQVYYITAERAARHGTLYRVSSLGGPPRKLVETVNDLGSLSPDGERLLFVRYGETVDLISANAADGSDERVLHSTGEDVLFRDPQFSADGKKIFFIRFDRIGGVENWSLVELPHGGREETVILPRQKPRISEIAILQNGRGLLLNSTDPISNLPQIYFLSLNDRKQIRITNDLNSYFGVSVDRVGENIVAAQRYDANKVWTGNLSDPTAMTPVTTEPNAYKEVAWTRDGRLVFDAVDNNRPHIYMIDSVGGNSQQLTPNESSDFQPRVSPDGRYIVFTSDRTGENKVWRINLDGSNPMLLTPGEGVADGPIISPDGGDVYFYWRKADSLLTGRVSIEGGEISEMPAIGEAYWALAPDGKQVAYTFFDPQVRRSRVGLRPFDSKEPLTILNISPIHILKWSGDGMNIIYREREEGENPYATLWTRDLRRKEATILLSVSPDTLFDFAVSPDGKSFSVVRGKLITDAVMMTSTRSGSPTP